MAFQLPKEPIRTRREFVLYLLATAAGVLLALSLQHAAEWWHTRSLVGEARQNLMLEIADNRQRIAKWRGSVPQIRKNLNEMVEFADESLRTGKSGKHSLSVNFESLLVTAAAWKAAEATGAVAHMPYDEAKSLAQAYDLQGELQRLQSDMLADLTEVMGFFSARKDPTRDQRPQDLDRLGDRVRTLGMRVVMMDNFAKGVDLACEQIEKRSATK
jgi:hypothetical protein